MNIFFLADEIDWKKRSPPKVFVNICVCVYIHITYYCFSFPSIQTIELAINHFNVQAVILVRKMSKLKLKVPDVSDVSEGQSFSKLASKKSKCSLASFLKIYFSTSDYSFVIYALYQLRSNSYHLHTLFSIVQCLGGGTICMFFRFNIQERLVY